MQMHAHLQELLCLEELDGLGKVGSLVIASLGDYRSL